MSDVIDRIVEKNQKFWKLTTDSTLTDAEKLGLLNELFPGHTKDEVRCPHGKRLWERCITCQFE